MIPKEELCGNPDDAYQRYIDAKKAEIAKLDVRAAYLHRLMQEAERLRGTDAKGDQGKEGGR